MNCATYMCEEIVIEILARLPAKSLVRFMAVCRLWKSIITSPKFRLHSKRPSKLLVHTDRGCYTLVEEEKRLLMFETDFPFKHCSDGYATVIGSDKGLVCIHITKPASSHHHRVIIWNPCIRKHVLIPDHVGDGIKTFSSGACGFGGTASCGGDYKYVHVRVVLESLKKVVYIYSLKAGTWRRKYLDDSDIKRGMGFCDDTRALLRGRLHWIGKSFKRWTNKIYSFELEDEVFENKFMVPEPIQSLENVKVTVIRESLAVITTDGIHTYSTSVCVWVMQEYGDVNSWNKLWNINVVEGFYEVDIAHLMKDGEFLLGLRGHIRPFKPKLVTCNPETMKTCDVGGGSFPSLSSTEQVCGFSYKESLVLLEDDYHAAADPVSGCIPFFWIFCSRVGRVVRRRLRLFIW